MGEPIVPTVQVEKLRLGADWWHAGKGRSQGSDPPCQGRLLSNPSTQGRRQLLGDVGWRGVLTESRCGPLSITDN